MREKFRADPEHPDVVWNMGLMNKTKTNREEGKYGDAPPVEEPEKIDDVFSNETAEPVAEPVAEPAAPSTDTDDLGLGIPGAEAQEVRTVHRRYNQEHSIWR